MAKKKTDYNVSLDCKYKSRYRERFSAEIKAENADEAKKIFIASLAENDLTLNILFSIDEELEAKMFNALQCEDITMFLAKKTTEANALCAELKAALITIKDVSPELLARFEDDYRSLRCCHYSKKGEELTEILQQCEILLESVEKCARLTKT